MYKFNPALMSYEDLKRTFVGRDDVLARVLKELDLPPGEKPRQHWLFIGPRGIGKSHLLTLLYHEIKATENLNRLWIPLLFPEELRRVYNLSDFFEKTISELSKEVTESEFSGISSGLAADIKTIKEKAKIGDERINAFIAVLKQAHEKTGKRFLLILENLQQLLGKKLSVNEQGRLRAFLQTEDFVLIIGSATTVFGNLRDHSKPFFNFFRIERLKDLKYESMKKLIESRIENNSSGRNRKPDEAKLKTVQAFTGGNPRLGGFMADILCAEMPSDVLGIIQGIIDEMTPYFDAIYYDVPEARKRILDTLAEFEHAQTPSQIAARLEITDVAARNYIKELKDAGYVRLAPVEGKRSYYCLNEYLYRIWFQMREGSMTEKNRWLVEFFLMLYSREELEQERLRILENGCYVPGQFVYDDCILAVPSIIECYPSMCNQIKSFREAIARDIEISNETAKIRVLRIIKLFDSKSFDEALGEIEELSQTEWNPGFINYAWACCLTMMGRLEEAINKITKAAEFSPENSTIYQVWAQCLRSLGRYVESIEKAKISILLESKNAIAHEIWAFCLSRLRQYDEAMDLARKALDLDPESSGAYAVLAECFSKKGNHEEAICQAQTALRLEPLNKRANMTLLRSLFLTGRYDEALSVSQAAVEIDSDDSIACLYYLSSLVQIGKYQEAIERAKIILLKGRNDIEGTIRWIAYRSFWEMGQYSEAVIEGMKALSAEPEMPNMIKDYKGSISLPVTKLQPDELMRKFLARDTEKFSIGELAALLMLTGRYDVIDDYLKSSTTDKIHTDSKEAEDIALVFFAVKLSLYIKISEGTLNDVSRLVKLFATISLIRPKHDDDLSSQKHVAAMAYDLSVLYSSGMASKESVSHVFDVLKAEPDIPYDRMIDVLWKCISEPESREAKVFMTEPPVEEAVRLILERAAKVKIRKEEEKPFSALEKL